MAQFKDVFSTTGKVILSLLAISALFGFGVLVFALIVSSVNQASSAAEVKTVNQHPGLGPSSYFLDEEGADDRAATIPKAKWDRGIARAVEHHCVTDGMNESDVLRAWGNPSSKSSFHWEWQLPAGNSEKLLLSEKGNAYMHGLGCETPDRNEVFDETELFR